MIAEVKYRKDLKEKWSVLKPKFKAAKEYAKDHNWEFKIYTEEEIRGVYLNNVKFLLQYRRNDNLPNDAYKERIMDIIEAIKVSTPEEILLMSFNDRNRQAELLPTLWNLVSTGLIGSNLFFNLNMKTCIWCITD